MNYEYLKNISVLEYYGIDKYFESLVKILNINE